MKKISIIGVILLLLATSLISFAFENNQVVNVESGWTRFNDTNANIQYDGWTSESTTPSSGFINNDEHYVLGPNGSIKFNFTGSSIRIYGGLSNVYTDALRITIDGTSYTVSEVSSDTVGIGSVLISEHLNLSGNEHSVIIENLGSQYGIFDGVDLFEGESLKPYAEISQPTPEPANYRIEVYLNSGQHFKYDVNETTRNSFLTWVGSPTTEYYHFEGSNSYLMHQDISYFLIDSVN